MSVNRHLPHLLVLPEDDANRQIANGFYLSLDWAVQRRLQVLPPAGGWTKVFDTFEADQVGDMDRCTDRFMVLIIDFDEDQGRIERAKQKIPERLANRVFVLGSFTQPERLKAAGLGNYEEIGTRLAADCRDEVDTVWRHELLRHNEPELARLRQFVRPILFG